MIHTNNNDHRTQHTIYICQNMTNQIIYGCSDSIKISERGALYISILRRLQNYGVDHACLRPMRHHYEGTQLETWVWLLLRWQQVQVHVKLVTGLHAAPRLIMGALQPLSHNYIRPCILYALWHPSGWAMPDKQYCKWCKMQQLPNFLCTFLAIDRLAPDQSIQQSILKIQWGIGDLFRSVQDSTCMPFVVTVDL